MKKKIILVGASTGGPSIIKELLSCIQTLSCTVIIAQHMREEVLPFFIKDLQNSLNVNTCTTPIERVFSKPSVVVCAHTSVLDKRNGEYVIVQKSDNQHYTPDINILFNSFVQAIDAFEITVFIMTGIGCDGIEGAENLKKRGATIIAQDEKSSPVYGMPKAAFESGIVDKVMSLDEIRRYFRGL